MPERVALRPFDGVLLVDEGAEESVGGLPLLERAAFVLARAGARRLLVCGSPRRIRRLPGVETAWDAPVARWLDVGTGPVVVLRGTTVIDPETLAAFAHDETPAPLVAPEAGLWRVDRATAVAFDGDATAALLAQKGALAWTPPPGALLVRATDGASRFAAERALYERLGRSGDGWFTKLVDRRLSRAVTRALLPTGIAPNHVTAFSIAIGVIGGLCFAAGTPTAALAGALLFLASTIVDGCDGEIARLTFRETAFGAKLDILGDNLVHLFLFGGIATGLYRRSADPVVAILGPVLIAGVLLAMATVYACVIRRQPTAAQQSLFEAFASREFAYLLVVLTLIGRLDWFLWMSAVGTYVFAFGLVVLGWRRPS